jgi:hypothetical protein
MSRGRRRTRLAAEEQPPGKAEHPCRRDALVAHHTYRVSISYWYQAVCTAGSRPRHEHVDWQPTDRENSSKCVD